MWNDPFFALFWLLYGIGPISRMTGYRLARSVGWFLFWVEIALFCFVSWRHRHETLDRWRERRERAAQKKRRERFFKGL